MNTLDKIKSLSKQHLNSIIDIRRHIHSNPELSFNEYNTADYITAAISKLGLPVTRMAKTGLVVNIQGKKPGKIIALRADIDALSIEEKNDVPYKSKNNGVMHACGHDAHSASLIGAAMILNELKNDFEGTIKLIFQPGEERLPGGASIMIKEGVLENPAPEVIFAQHVFPSLETGKVGFCGGTYMASCDEIYLTVKGKGGHAAMPANYINPIIIASEILLDLNNKFMKHPKNDIPTVLAFGKVQANGATNVIPQEVVIDGTFRTMNEEWRSEAHEIIKNTIKTKAKEMGGDCEVRIDIGYPVLFNNNDTTAHAQKAAEQYLGKENVVTLEKRMTSEDFAFYSLIKPACFYRLGTGNIARGITSGVHTSTFDIDEKSLETGMGLMAWIAISELSNK
ncbi:MAG TPA: M20 family metallopeptidase [Bacteroidia bacterium]|nr:M20 family metallopeptidase [Bacteroidia bacterium]